MYDDDEPLFDPVGYDDEYDNELLPESIVLGDSVDDSVLTDRRRNCLFIAVSILLIISLVGSSIIILFIAVRNDGWGVARERVERVKSGPTAAPATVAAAVFTPLPVAEPIDSPNLPEINRIAIINQDGQLETMSPVGTDRHVLTLRSDRVAYQLPTWAPDGNHLAVVGNQPSGGGVYVLEDVPPGEPITIADRRIYFSDNQPPFYLYWSPDGDRLAFLAEHSRGLVGLNVVDKSGIEAARVLAIGSSIHWDWSRDGRQMLVHTERSRSNRSLTLVDMSGQAATGNLAVPGDFQAPGIGQDGRYWAFAERTNDGLSALVVVDTQSGGRQAYDRGGSLALGWSPVRDQIAFTHSAPNSHPLWGPLRRLDVATGEIRVLSSQAVLAFFWSPDGRSIAFITLSRDTNDTDISAYKEDGVRRANRVAFVPVQRPGRTMLTLSVIDVESGTGLRLLDFQPTVAYLSQFLPYFDQYALSHRIWAPDSSAIVLPVREDDANRIYVVPTDGRRPYYLADGAVAFWSRN